MSATAITGTHSSVHEALHVGVIINPLAGLGGTLAHKGSDDDGLRNDYLALPEEQRRRAMERTARALQVLDSAHRRIRYSCAPGDMGQTLFNQLGLEAETLGVCHKGVSSAVDTRRSAGEMLTAGVELLLFAGGDGTARDILDAVGEQLPVLGIPAGVKMHSGVFAISPEAAGELLKQLLRGDLVALKRAEVRDIDESAFREGRVRSRFYGEMLVPAFNEFLQHTKVGGREDAELAAADIASWIADSLQPGCTYCIGPGSTTAAIKEELGIEATLLGVDVVRDGQLLAADADEKALLSLLEGTTGGAEIIVTAIGGQGHVFGRGNQQLSPAVIRAVGIDNIRIVAVKSKLSQLQGRPLLVDTNDALLDRELHGYHAVVTGYDDQVLYRIGHPWES